MDEKNIQSSLVDTAREVVAAAVTAQDIAYWMRKAKLPRGMALKNVDVDAGRVHFSLASYPWSFSDWTLRTDFGNRTDLEMSLRNTQYYTTGIAEALGLTGKITPGSWGVNNNHLLKNTKASLHRKRISSLPKIIEGLIAASGAEKQADYIETQMRLKAKAKVVQSMASVSMPRPWQRDYTGYSSPSYRPIVVKGVKLGRYSVVWETSGTDIIITAKVESNHETLKSAEKTGKLNGGRYRSVEAGQKAVIAAANKLVKELRGNVDAVSKKFEQAEMSKQKWFSAIDKRANTAFRGARPYKDNNQNRRGYFVYEFKAGGKAIYYIAIGINKIQVDKKGMKGRMYVHLGTYVDTLKKYLKTPSNSDVFDDYFNESETIAEKMVDFRVMADITKAFKAMTADVKRGVAMAKREGKEATPETANFLERKFGKVDKKRREREYAKEQEQKRRYIQVYEENSKPGLKWSAASHDQGYAERVVEGFNTMEEAQDYILDDVGGGDDWVVVYGTQLDGKRLGRVEEDYDDE